MKKQILILMILTMVLSPSVIGSRDVSPKIQIALLLDTSNSMDGLIDQAKTQLWKIVNEFIPMSRDGRKPELQVALFEYGNDSLSATEGHIRLVLPFTSDLDRVSQELFALTTNGGEEYCGQVIRSSLDRLAWTSHPWDLKAVFIAGNEPFTQGRVDYRESCRQTAKKGIPVNTIFCGPFGEGVETKWKAGATLSGGSYMNIDQNVRHIHIIAPQDDIIIRLGVELNATYIPYGVKGKVGAKNQEAQDKNAMTASEGGMVQRSISKSSSYYGNLSWDLVDAVRNNEVALEDVKNAEFPEEMQKMSPEEKATYVAQKQKERARIQSEIQKQNDARKKYVTEKQRELAETGEDTLDSALIRTLQSQAVEKGFSLK